MSSHPRSLRRTLRLIRNGPVGSVIDGSLCVHRFGPHRFLAASWEAGRRPRVIRSSSKALGTEKTTNRLPTSPDPSAKAASSSADGTTAEKFVVRTADSFLTYREKPVLKPTKTMKERERLETTLATGITSVDTLAPIGRGASMAILYPDAALPSEETEEAPKKQNSIDSFIDGLVKGSLQSRSVDEVVQHEIHDLQV